MECVDLNVTLAIIRLIVGLNMHVVPLYPKAHKTHTLPVTMERVDGIVTLAILSVEIHVVNLVVNAPAD
jgi:hypothetical protein